MYQYQTKYSKDLGQIVKNFISYDDLKEELSKQILNLHELINGEVGCNVKEEVIVLDYLITLKQLLKIMEQDNLLVFHNKSKI